MDRTDTHLTGNGTGPRRLLVLDDDLATGETLCRIARHNGVDARATTNAADFFEAIAQWQPDALAVDLMMPGQDGVEVMGSLVRLGCQAGIIITSGVGERVLDAASRSAREKGLNIIGTLPKPFSAATLRSLLQAASGSPACQGNHRGFDSPDFTDQQLRTAIEDAEITFALQPKFHCNTGTLAGFEVLARWPQPDQTMIPPDRFIARAEQLDLIDDLTRLMMDRALHWLAHQDTRQLPSNLASHLTTNTTLSVNLSALSLGHGELFDWIAERCQHHQVAPQRIIFEITESSAMKDPVRSLETLTRLRVQGFQLSIDDFGTGYSSMLQLVRLPFSEIKVDKTFVIQAARSAESRAVIRSVIDLGHSLGLSATAEGVEDVETLAFLRDCQCDQIQGFLMARPMAPDQVLPWLTRREQQREQERIQALQRTGLLDTPPEPRFDRITRLASRVFRVPVVLVVLIDDQRQFFKSATGVQVREVPRGHAFCDWTLAGDELLVVPDTLKDPRFRDLPSVRKGPRFRFYAGRPVCLANGQKAGTLCMMDQQVRELSPEQQALFHQLADMVEQELRLPSDQVTDSLTGLPDRLAFRHQMELARDISQRLACRSALIIVTLNNLGETNRRLGREAGNRMIRQLSQILQQLETRADLTGRYRGNEFGVVLIDTHTDQAAAFCQDLTRAINDWNRQYGGGDPQIWCHIGLAWLDPASAGSRERDIEVAIEQARQRIVSVTGNGPSPT